MTGAIGRIGLLMLTAAILAGCQDGMGPFAKKPEGDAAAAPVETASARSVKLVDRDVEAPDVFQVTDNALWDGRPSLGGVWVAAPEVKDPERVILRNPGNGKFVIGALFRREIDNPGPKLQISSDAAAALGILAGQPVKISVTALRREEAPVAAPDATKPILDANESVETRPLGAAAVATAALDRADAGGAKPIAPTAPPPAGAKPPAAAAKPPAQPAAAPKPPAPPAAAAAAPAASGGGSLIQIGIFSVEANAKRAADTLNKAGVTTNLRKEESAGKTFWSVTARGDAATLSKVKGAGFKDAYVLKR